MIAALLFIMVAPMFAGTYKGLKISDDSEYKDILHGEFYMKVPLSHQDPQYGPLYSSIDYDENLWSGYAKTLVDTFMKMNKDFSNGVIIENIWVNGEDLIFIAIELDKKRNIVSAIVYCIQ